MKISTFTRIMLIIMVLLTEYSSASVCTATVSGNWSDPLIWSCGNVPGCGDLVTIPAGLTVTIDVQVTLAEPGCNTPTYILVYGTMQFQPGNKMDLAFGSGVEIMPGGFLLRGAPGHSNEINVTGAAGWFGGQGNKAGYFLIGNPVPLPVEFVNFKVIQEISGFRFDWEVANERENDFFTLFYSEDGIAWKMLSNISSVGDHIEKLNYSSSFELKIPFVRTVYFKLSQTDKNGIMRDLNIQVVNRDVSDVVVFPNPVEQGNKLNIHVESTEAEQFEIAIRNAQGQEVKKFNLQGDYESNVLEIETQDLIPGIYVVTFTGLNSMETMRVVIQ